MQATLVSHYGEKPEKLASYVKQCQRMLSSSLEYAFTAYKMPQIHSTIIGLEGCLKNGAIKNTNFFKYRQEIRLMDPSKILAVLRSPYLPEFNVQIGGYIESENYGFLSQGQHPYLRSFSIQGNIAVAMGWPTGQTSVLEDFRRSFIQFNVLHKWHKTESAIDNDFFFVLGRINRNIVREDTIADTEANVRQFMASSDPIIVKVNAASMQIVCYSDAQLPLSTSRVHAIQDATFTPDDLSRCYDESNDDE